MKYRRLGKSGLKVSELSFGSWVTFNKQVDSKLAEKMFGICFDAGINFFDNAEGYEAGESEVVMGNALKSMIISCIAKSGRILASLEKSVPLYTITITLDALL